VQAQVISIGAWSMGENAIVGIPLGQGVLPLQGGMQIVVLRVQGIHWNFVGQEID
jgi:hypothetical protein